MPDNSQEQDKVIKDTYTQIKVILGLMKAVDKLDNDVVGGSIKRMLMEELKGKHDFIDYILKGE